MTIERTMHGATATGKPNSPPLPDGFIAVRVGGRPRNEARDAAVFLAKLWRMEKHQENATTAEQWVVDSWEGVGKTASKGISETAHVRAAIGRARNRGLNKSLIMLAPQAGGMCTAIECDKQDDGAALKNGARSWHWCDGLTKAAEGKVGNLKVEKIQEVFHKSPTALAAIYCLHGLS